MKIETQKIDSINAKLNGTIDVSVIEKALDRLAKEAQKHVKVDGFRPGKVPLAMVKKIHGDKLRQDAEAEALRAFIDEGLKKAGIDAAQVIGQPLFKAYGKKENGDIDVELVVSTRPEFDVSGYESVVPKFEKPSVSEKELEGKLKRLAEDSADFVPLKRKRALKEGDLAIIDFEGFIDGEPFEGGKAENYNLVIGSGQFIPGFEEQLVGMKIDEEKEIGVKFPEEYGAKELAGKEATFKVKLNEIRQKGEASVDDELAKKLLRKEDATLDELRVKLKEQLEHEKLQKLYHEELKPKLVEALVKQFDFDLPQNIVEQEIDVKLNAKLSKMSVDELNALREDEEKVKAMREELRGEAEDSVKATFIVDKMAQAEKIEVSDEDVQSALYYEAIMSGQEPAQVMAYYQENNLLPAVKMGMIEDRLFTKLLGLEQ